MPAVLSHYLLAQRVIKDLNEFQPQLNIDSDAFAWGASGPDIFFTHKVLPLQRGRCLGEYGRRIHHTPANKLINFMYDYSVKNNNDLFMSYTLGFITHYAFDSIAHPFILHASGIMHEAGPEIPEIVCHNHIEACLDTLFLRYECKKKISSFRLQRTAPIKSKVNFAVARLLGACIRELYDDDISTDLLIGVQRDWHRSLILLNDRASVKKTVVRMGERAVGLKPMLSPMMRVPYPDLSFDYANMKRMPWYSEQDDAEHTENFFDLIDLAEESSLEMIMILLAGIPLSREQCRKSFSGHSE